MSIDQDSDSLCSLRMPGEGGNLTGWPRVLRSPSRHEVVFYGTLPLGWLDPLVPTGGGLHDPLEKAAAPKQPDGTDACWGATASMTVGTQETTHLLMWAPQQAPDFRNVLWKRCFNWRGLTAAGICPLPTARVYSNSSIESVMPSNHLILCCPLLLSPSIFPSIRVFPNESALLIRWAKLCSFSFNISSSNEYSGLISFRMDWLNLLALQGTLKSLLQHHSSKASILRHSAFFIVQLSHPYMTTKKIIPLTRQNIVGKEMFLLLNMLSRLVITILPRSKRLSVSWLQSPSAVILELPKVNHATGTFSPSICHEVMGPDAMIFVFWMLSFKPTFSLSSFTFVKSLFSSSMLWCSKEADMTDNLNWLPFSLSVETSPSVFPFFLLLWI